MTKKILFLLTFLLTTLGGGKLWAAPAPVNVVFGNDVTITVDGQAVYNGSSSLFSLSFGEKTATQNWVSQDFSYKSYTKKLLIYEDNSDYFVFTPSKNGTLVVDYNISSSKTFVIEKNSLGSGNYAYSSSSSSGDCTTPEVEVTAGTTYYVRGLGTKAGYYGFTFTPEAKTNTVDYPHTWTFNYGSSNWPNTVGDMLTANSKWTLDAGRYKYNGTTTTDGGDYLYDGDNDYVEETRGLKFYATTSTDIQTDLHFDVMLQNGASVIVPNVKIGQKIVVRGWWPDGGTVTAFNAQLSGGATSFSGTGADAEYTFDVIANGDARFTVGSGSNYDIWSIAVTKIAQSIAYPNSTVEISYGGTIVNTLNVTSNPSHNTITYASSDTHVATVAANGTVEVHNAGSCTITATLPGSDIYEEASSSYTLTVNATSTPTLAWDQRHSETIPDNGTATVKYGNNLNCYCTNSGQATVQYRSSDTNIATVAIQNGNVGGSYKYCQITPVNVGTVTITAFVPSFQGEAETSISFTLTVTKGDIDGKLYFSPSSGTVQTGYTIGPRLKFPTMLAEDIEELTAVSSDGSKATVALEMNDTYLSYQNEKVDGVYPIVRGVNKGTATITVTFHSKKYESATATYTVEVVESQSWNWSEPDKEYKLYTEDFMKIPEIDGNTTGNFQLSVGSYNATNGGYIYDIKNGAITYNNKDWHRGEGVPNYTIVTEGIENPGAAKIFWCKGGDNDGAALFVFAQSAGDVKLRATDTQTGEYSDLTIHILNKTSYGTYTDPTANNIIGATYGSSGNVHTNWSQIATTPFTWDFTTNFTVSDDTNCYWINNGDGSYSLGYPTSFNYDWADTDNNGKTAASGGNGNYESKFKAIHLKQMEGMTIYLANNDGSWENKVNKVRILAAGTDAQGKPKGRLNINGGTFKLTVPNIPKTALASSYKVFVKAVSDGGSNPLVNIVVNGTQNENTPTTTPGIFSADVTTGQKVELWLNNVTIYWIAFSTEANYTAKHDDNKTLTYAATSYSYGKALDLAKSEEVNNGLTAYYASKFTNGQDVASTVILRQVTLDIDRNRVPANTGLVLKSNNPLTNYMIADAENQDSYSEPTELSGNYLVAGPGAVVNSTTGSGEGIKTNFALSYAYKKFADDGTTAMTGYQYDRDWSFYKVMPYANVPKGKAYLQVPGNLRVKSDGTIEEVTPAGSRRAADGSDDDRPANKLMLDIVYEDEAHGFDATTAINDVKTDTVTVDDDAWYTLQGVRVNTPARGGIYIHNGRKVVIK